LGVEPRTKGRVEPESRNRVAQIPLERDKRIDPERLAVGRRLLGMADEDGVRGIDPFDRAHPGGDLFDIDARIFDFRHRVLQLCHRRNTPRCRPQRSYL